MSGAGLAIFCLFCFYLAYHTYGKFLSKKVFPFESDGETPAHRRFDGVEFVPTNRFVLFGHHFASIAGLGPILGPAIAVIWGWLPAVLWVVLGCIFIGAVHDLMALGISLRHEGQSIGEITSSVMGKRARLLFLLIIFFVLSLAMGVFALVIAQVLTHFHPQAVLPTVALIGIALLMGVSVYKYKVSLRLATVVGVPLVFASLFLGIWQPVALYPLFLSSETQRKLLSLERQKLGDELYFVTDVSQSRLDPKKHLHLAEAVQRENQRLERQRKAPIVYEPFDLAKGGHVKTYFGEKGDATAARDVARASQKAVQLWIVLLLLYALVASVLPVWLLLQPRDYLNSFQLYAGGLLLYGGLFLGMPQVVAPMWNEGAYLLSTHESTLIPPLLPFLFITIACGAVSGFHCLVASGTTVRQLDRESDSLFVAYGGMLSEGALAIGVILACVAGYASQEAWAYFYRDWSAMKGLGAKLSAFVGGAATFLSYLGIPKEVGKTFMALVTIGFAMTTLDSATRLLRYNVEELGRAVGVSFLENRYVASGIAFLSIAFFAFLKIGGKPAGLVLWALFGTSNQLLGGIALLVITVYLYRSRRPTVYTFLPMVFLLSVTFTAMAINWWAFWKQGNVPLIVVGGALLLMTLWLAAEAFRVYWQERKKQRGETGQ